MVIPNTLIFVDLPSPDPPATADFYREVFGWEVEGRPAHVFHRIVPGGEFLLDDGTASGVGNLHMGIYDVHTALPDPNLQPAGGTDRPSGPLPRVYILVSPDDSQDRILARAEALGAEILWRDWYWSEFNGFHSSFRDPWGTQIVLWTKGGESPSVPEGRRVDDKVATAPS
jgi:predicted enzyme related to lactoylglutathione lyase